MIDALLFDLGNVLIRWDPRNHYRDRFDTPEAMDRVWEEEAVRFGVEAPGEDCNPPTRLPSGVKRNEPTVTP